jgi:hypothetical protein
MHLVLLSITLQNESCAFIQALRITKYVEDYHVKISTFTQCIQRTVIAAYFTLVTELLATHSFSEWRAISMQFFVGHITRSRSRSNSTDLYIQFMPGSIRYKSSRIIISVMSFHAEERIDVAIDSELAHVNELVCALNSLAPWPIHLSIDTSILD